MRRERERVRESTITGTITENPNMEITEVGNIYLVNKLRCDGRTHVRPGSAPWLVMMTL
jgi:hypothetical protein